MNGKTNLRRNGLSYKTKPKEYEPPIREPITIVITKGIHQFGDRAGKPQEWECYTYM